MEISIASNWEKEDNAELVIVYFYMTGQQKAEERWIYVNVYNIHWKIRVRELCIYKFSVMMPVRPFTHGLEKRN